MGYTHYWSLGDWDSPKWQEAWPLLVDDVPKIIRAANVDLSGPTDDPDVMTPVLVDIEKGIHLNGVEYDSYESFIISKKDTGEFNFCKTARRPYDIVVTCILLRAWMLAPDDFRPSSDGDTEEWGPARDLHKSLWPEDYVDEPWTKEDAE